MSQILLGNNASLPNGITFDGKTLTVAKRQVFEDTVTIKLVDRVISDLLIKIEESTQIKFILDIEDLSTEPSNYTINLEAKPNSNVKFLFIANIHNHKSELYFNSKSYEDSNLEFIGGFVSDQVRSEERRVGKE